MAANVRLQFMPGRNDTAVIAAMCLASGLLLAASLCNRRVTFSQAPVANPSGITAARQFIDPNTADEASLARLPYIHKTRAAMIATFAQTHDRPFACGENLAKVKGIGRKTAWRVRRYLAIPYEKPAAIPQQTPRNTRDAANSKEHINAPAREDR